MVPGDCHGRRLPRNDILIYTRSGAVGDCPAPVGNAFVHSAQASSGGEVGRLTAARWGEGVRTFHPSGKNREFLPAPLAGEPLDLPANETDKSVPYGAAAMGHAYENTHRRKRYTEYSPKNEYHGNKM